MHDVNWLAVLVAGIIPLVVGFLWYGPIFGKQWLSLMETTAEAQLLAVMGGSGAMVGVHVGLLVTIGFVLNVGYQGVAYEQRKPGIFFLSLGYNGVALIAQAVLLAAWR